MTVQDPATATLGAPVRSDPHPGWLRAVLHAAYDAAWILAALLSTPWLLYRSLVSPGFFAMATQRLGFGLPKLDPPAEGVTRVLVHGVSVGEIKAAVPVVRQLLAREERVEVVVSSTTDSGTELARKLFADLVVVRFPIDIAPLVSRFLRRLEPDCVVLLELEIWPNFLRGANRRGISVAVVNGRITEKSYSRYRRFRQLLPQHDRISLFCVQEERYAERFRRLSIDPARIVVTGNVKADGLRLGRAQAPAELSELLGGARDQMIGVAGSTHEPEELELVRAWLAAESESRLVLVPRHPERADSIVRRLAQEGVETQRLSELRRGSLRPDPGLPVLVDTIGELEQVYALADWAFVGGSLIPHGGQNILEPAAQGIPVLFGPSMENFAHEAELLLRHGAAIQVGGVEELVESLRRLERDRAFLRGMAEAGARAVESQQGATARTLDYFARVCLA